MLAFSLLVSLQSASFQASDFEKHVRFLASPEMKGRDNNTPEGLKAAQYIADQFRELGLKPAGREGYFQDFTARDQKGRNVLGLLPGEKTGEVIVVAAHHDARGVIGGKVQAGADDNASGVAMVLELARSFKGTTPGRSILFASFDCEEDGLLGSREFVKSGLLDMSTVAAMLVFDLIGGDFMEWEKNRIYALGSEYSAELFERIRKDAQETKDLEVVRGAVALIEPYPDMARSDYHAFRGKGVPFIFFSTGTPWYYHTEYDTPDRLNYPKMAKAAAFVRRVIAETASDEKRPVFRAPVRVEEDTATVREALDRILANKDRLRLTEKQLEAVKTLRADLPDGTTADQKKLQQAMILLFTIARSQGTP
jgi:hypothetical protein